MSSNNPRKVDQKDGGVNIGGNVSNSNVAGRDMIQNFYSSLPLPGFVKDNAKLVTAVYAGICEVLAILATMSDIRQWQTATYPPALTPYSILQNLPLPTMTEIIGMFIKNNILFFGLGVVVAAGIIFAFAQMQKK